jgi:ribosomal protein S18 acetylase RimI-like enzyme
MTEMPAPGATARNGVGKRQAMTQTTIRPVNIEDRRDVDELCLAALAGEDTGDAAGLQRLLWDTDGVQGFVATTAPAPGGEAATLVGAVFGTVATEADGTVAGAVTLLAVDAGHRRQGIGGALLGRLEEGFRAAGAVEVWSGGGQPRFWWPGIDAGEAGVLSFFRGHGYVDDDDAVNMRVDLTTAELDGPPPPDGITLRRLLSDEWPAFLAWMDDTWDDPWGAEVANALQRQPVSCFVATRDDDYLGFAAYDTNRRGWFGPMGSSPGARGTGIGRALLRLCLRDFVDQGLTRCEIGWVGPFDFYSNAVGAVRSRTFLRLRKDLPG